MTTSWLCRDDMDRARLLDMEERIRPVRAVALGILALALVASAPWLGWWTLLPLALAAILFQGAGSRISRSERPEYLMFAAWAGAEVLIAAAVALAGGLQATTLSWLAIPIVTLSARFSQRGVYLGVGIALVLLCAVAFSQDAASVAEDPSLIIAPAALIVAVAILSTALMRSDLEHRGDAVIDPLTGLLNRKALNNRVSELEEQSRVTGQPVGVVIADLDDFKKVNDTLGHALGDAVLEEAAQKLLSDLRAFDLAYRIGGEEFLILLPGADLAECVEHAESLRKTIERSPFSARVELTASFGVSASERGKPFDYKSVFAAADASLYEAKDAGRNRVGVAGDEPSKPGTVTRLTAV